MDRYKVAIVDDDELSLDNLVFGLQKFENFHLEGTARNGVSGKKRGSRNLVGIIVSYSHPKFRPLPHGNKSIGGVGSHRASL